MSSGMAENMKQGDHLPGPGLLRSSESKTKAAQRAAG